MASRAVSADAAPGIAVRDTRRAVPVWALTALFTVAVLAAVYATYPFDGMVLEESWTIYTAPPLDRGVELLFVRRGISNLVRMLMTAGALTPTAVNVICVALQALNLALFARVVHVLAGPARVFPMVAVALLYPFASSARFWQIGFLHHLSATLFLAALVLWLRACWGGEARRRDLVGYGAASLACFWLSLGVMEHAILMPALFLYLALYVANGRSAVLKLRWKTSPAVALSLCYLGVSVAYVAMFVGGGYAESRLNFLASSNAQRFEQLGSVAHLPGAVVAPAVVALNALFFLGEALFANTVGFLAHPLLFLSEHRAILLGEVGRWGIPVLGVAALGAWTLGSLSARDADGGRDARDRRFLLTVGALWALLAYLPPSSSFAYPRIVGQSADRVNGLAVFGIAIAGGVLIAWACGVASRARRRAVVAAAAFVVMAVLLANIDLQRELWVEAYEKERRVVVDVLRTYGPARTDGRRPVVLIDREDKPESVRARLRRALGETSGIARLREVAKVVMARHFTERGEIEVTGFHLRGIPLLGGNPEGAGYVFDNYARRLSLAPVPVYKMDHGFVMTAQADDVRLGYGAPELARVARCRVEPVVIALAPSYFQFRGAVNYQVKPAAAWPGREGCPDGA